MHIFLLFLWTQDHVQENCAYAILQDLVLAAKVTESLFLLGVGIDSIVLKEVNKEYLV